MLTNHEVAILAKVNELAARFGVPECSFLASVQSVQDQGGLLQTRLAFEYPPTEVAVAERFETMLDLIGGSIADEGAMTATDEQLAAVLDAALHCAPKRRGLT